MRLRAVFLMICCGLVGSSFPGIRIIENTSKKFTFEWTTDNLRVAAGADASVSFTGANVDLGDNGEPIIPAYSLHVGVPLQGTVSVKLDAAASHTEQITSPLRVRNAPGLGPRFPGLRFAGPWISEPQYVKVGRLRCGRFIIRPVLYDKGSNTVRVLDKAQCTIEFPPAAQAGAAPVPSSSDFGHMVKRLVINYSVAAGWAAAAGMPKRAAIKAFPLDPSRSMISFRVGDGHNGLGEGTIDENGIIRIMASDVTRILGSAPISNVALYASYKGEMPAEVPELAQLPDGVSEVPLLRFDLNKNGLADSSDYFLAYVSSISDWRYEPSSFQYFYKLDPYEDYRHYWMTVKSSPGLTLAKMQPVAGAPAATFTWSKGHCLLKKSVSTLMAQGHDGGLEWAWTRLNYYMPSFTLENFVLQNIDYAAPCSVLVGVGYNASAPSLSITVGGTKACQGCPFNGWQPLTLADNQPLTLSIAPADRGDTLELKHVEFRYTQKLDMSNTMAMTVFSPEESLGTVVRYKVSGLSGDLLYIVRIANSDASMALIDTVRTAGTYEWSDSAGTGVRYYLCREQGVRPAPSLEMVQPKSSTEFTIRDLRNLTVPVDYLIVTHPNFMVQAQRLARHKRNVFPERFRNPKAISMGDIYDQFSGGNIDPAAVRNALMYVRDQVSARWPTSFDYVVLMGLGHYDYRNIATSDTSFVPVAIFREKCLEDFFVYLQPGENPDGPLSTPDCFIGRIPCQTADAAAKMVDKIIQMEDPTFADFGGWRNRVILVADDDMQGLKADQLGHQHTEASEIMDTIISHLQPAVDMRKVYLFEYDWNSLREKPEASQALINGINNGAAVVNYFGHGSAEVLADEHILLPENIGNMQNNGRYPLIASFSCSVGKFDQPGKKRSLSEYLVLAEKSAAIATVSSMREAYASDNQKLAGNFFAAVYDTSDTAARTFGEALALAKSQSRDDNQKVYSYLGDPSLQTLRPARKVQLSISDDNGKALDSIKALMQVTIRGTVVQNNGAPDPQFGTTTKPAAVLVSMFNPAFLTSRKDSWQSIPGVTLSNATYKMPGVPIFAGQTKVVNGTFVQTIIIPKNVTLDKNGALLTAYAWDGPTVALGYKKDFIFHGFGTLSVHDTIGPTISVRPVYNSGSAGVDASASKGASFTDRITAPLPLTLEVMLFDSNGIDVVSTGPDEGLTFEVPGVVARKNINYKFQFNQGDFRRGEAGWTFNDGAMPPGIYTLHLSAQDLLGNVSRKSITIEITAPLELALYHVFNYPNPMRMGESCKFYFDLSKTTSQSPDDRVKVSLRIFTLSGRLVRVFNDLKRGELFDGKDNFKNPLSPGVYLYQMIAEDKLQQKVVKSKIEKLAINPPR